MAATFCSMSDDRIRKVQGQRLAEARLKAGWRSSRSAAIENGWAESSYRAHENGSRTIGLDDAEIYARRFRAAGVSITAQEILFGSGSGAPHDAGSIPDELIVAGARIPLSDRTLRGGARDLPVPGIALGGSEEEGDFQLNGEVQYYLDRPAGLVGRKRAFAVVIRNDSMIHSYKPSWPIFVDPDGRQPVAGVDDVLIELYPNEEGRAGPAFVKKLISRRGNEVVLWQQNPEKEIRFPIDRVKQILRVIPYPEAMGLAV